MNYSNLFSKNYRVYLFLAVAIVVLANELSMIEASKRRFKANKLRLGHHHLKRSQDMGYDDTNLCILACAECDGDELNNSEEHDANVSLKFFFLLLYSYLIY